MDDVLASLLACFQAHYKVMKDDLATTGTPLPVLEHLPPDPPSKGLATVAVRDIVFFDNYADNEGDNWHVSDDNGEEEEEEEEEETLIPEECNQAEQDLDHTFVLAHVAEVVRHSEWPEDDHIPSSNLRTSTPLTPARDTEASRPPLSNNRRRWMTG